MFSGFAWVCLQKTKKSLFGAKRGLFGREEEEERGEHRVWEDADVEHELVARIKKVRYGKEWGATYGRNGCGGWRNISGWRNIKDLVERVEGDRRREGEQAQVARLC